MATVAVYPPEGKQYPDAAGVPITSAGAIVDVSKYILDALRRHKLLDWDPLGIYQPDDRTNPSGGGGSGALVFGTAALLSAGVGSADQVCTLLCHTSSGDGGGGDFYWDSGSSTTADGGCVFGAGAGGRWKRLFNGPRCAKWYGAVGDGTTDDTAALQAWIDAIPVGGEGYMDIGNYRITSGLLVSTNDVTIRGPSGRNTTLGARIIWDGDDETEFAITFCAMGQTLERVHFTLTKSCRGFVEAGRIDGSLSSNFHLRESFMLGASANGSPTFDYGVAIGYTSPTENNMEYMAFEDVVVTNALRAGFYNGGNPNALGHTWDRCAVTNFMGEVGGIGYVDSGFSDGITHPYGIGIELVGGNQVAITDCRFGHLECCVYFPGSSDRDFITVTNADAEVCKKLIYGSFANAGHVIVEKCRAPLNYVQLQSAGPHGFSASDVKICELYAGASSTLSLRDCSLVNSDGFTSVINETIRAPSINADSCTFSGTQPWSDEASTRIYSFNNRGSNGFTGTSMILDGIYQAPDFTNVPVHFDALQGFSPLHSLNAGSVGTLPASVTPRRNRAGKVTITDAATSSVVSFPATEADATYIIRINVVSTTGSPASGAYTALALSKATTGFTLTPLAAPGVGSSVTYVWELVSGFGI